MRPETEGFVCLSSVGCNSVLSLELIAAGREHQGPPCFAEAHGSAQAPVRELTASRPRESRPDLSLHECCCRNGYERCLQRADGSQRGDGALRPSLAMLRRLLDSNVKKEPCSWRKGPRQSATGRVPAAPATQQGPVRLHFGKALPSDPHHAARQLLLIGSLYLTTMLCRGNPITTATATGPCVQSSTTQLPADDPFPAWLFIEDAATELMPSTDAINCCLMHQPRLPTPDVSSIHTFSMIGRDSLKTTSPTLPLHTCVAVRILVLTPTLPQPQNISRWHASPNTIHEPSSLSFIYSVLSEPRLASPFHLELSFSTASCFKSSLRGILSPAFSRMVQEEVFTCTRGPKWDLQVLALLCPLILRTNLGCYEIISLPRRWLHCPSLFSYQRRVPCRLPPTNVFIAGYSHSSSALFLELENHLQLSRPVRESVCLHQWSVKNISWHREGVRNPVPICRRTVHRFLSVSIPDAVHVSSSELAPIMDRQAGNSVCKIRHRELVLFSLGALSQNGFYKGTCKGMARSLAHETTALVLGPTIPNTLEANHLAGLPRQILLRTSLPEDKATSIIHLQTKHRFPLLGPALEVANCRSAQKVSISPIAYPTTRKDDVADDYGEAPKHYALCLSGLRDLQPHERPSLSRRKAMAAIKDMVLVNMKHGAAQSMEEQYQVNHQTTLTIITGFLQEPTSSKPLNTQQQQQQQHQHNNTPSLATHTQSQTSIQYKGIGILIRTLPNPTRQRLLSSGEFCAEKAKTFLLSHSHNVDMIIYFASNPAPPTSRVAQKWLRSFRILFWCHRVTWRAACGVRILLSRFSLPSLERAIMCWLVFWERTGTIDAGLCAMVQCSTGCPEATWNDDTACFCVQVSPRAFHDMLFTRHMNCRPLCQISWTIAYFLLSPLPNRRHQSSRYPFHSYSETLAAFQAMPWPTSLSCSIFQESSPFEPLSTPHISLIPVTLLWAHTLVADLAFSPTYPGYSEACFNITSFGPGMRSDHCTVMSLEDILRVYYTLKNGIIGLVVLEGNTKPFFGKGNLAKSLSMSSVFAIISSIGFELIARSPRVIKSVSVRRVERVKYQPEVDKAHVFYRRIYSYYCGFRGYMRFDRIIHLLISSQKVLDHVKPQGFCETYWGREEIAHENTEAPNPFLTLAPSLAFLPPLQ
ncbi:uncharacterized protein BDR25DRAFT_349946 [Lindgomyces ingoldianus]|uniref:Uncharacterized protein n=1 Tax=Lindgomyces ingoldianus TaxID=673940 RepID=A0ACB6R934_9PLEO|nr:uncharacterized protein BDR25DRAFT_349946 [Lindgomyces ingoldianus]KAF2475661.1 hypothetical protein BDR25DRAFT_349946 [Lindgomyces ingoldianus]